MKTERWRLHNTNLASLLKAVKKNARATLHSLSFNGDSKHLLITLLFHYFMFINSKTRWLTLMRSSGSHCRPNSRRASWATERPWLLLADLLVLIRSFSLVFIFFMRSDAVFFSPTMLFTKRNNTMEIHRTTKSTRIYKTICYQKDGKQNPHNDNDRVHSHFQGQKSRLLTDQAEKFHFKIKPRLVLNNFVILKTYACVY